MILLYLKTLCLTLSSKSVIPIMGYYRENFPTKHQFNEIIGAIHWNLNAINFPNNAKIQIISLTKL